MNLRSARQIEREAKLLANVGRGMPQSCERQLMFFFVAGDGDVNAGVPADCPKDERLSRLPSSAADLPVRTRQSAKSLHEECLQLFLGDA